MGLPEQDFTHGFASRLAWPPSAPAEWPTSRTGVTGRPDTRTAVPDLDAYRAAVAELAREIEVGGVGQNRYRVAAVVTERITAPELLAVLAGTPGGADGAIRGVLSEIRSYRPRARSSALDLAGLVRVFLLSRIDVMWWCGAPEYLTNADVLESTELVDLTALRAQGRLAFRYRRQYDSLAVRAVRALDRRLLPDRSPRTPGLRFTRTRPECVALLNQLAGEFARRSPRGMPPLWVTSLTRSVQHQLHLRELGYAAVRPSGHCLGYAMDVEMAWYRRYDGHHTLRALLLERQDAGDVNVIDEGEAWHVCLGPVAAARLRRDLDTTIGG